MNAPEPLWRDHEAPLGIAYARCGAGSSEGLDTPTYWHHVEGRWTAPWAAADHIQPFTRPHAHDQSSQAAVVPMQVATTPSVSALIYSLAKDNAIGGHIETLGGVELAGQVTRGRLGLSL